MTPRLSSPASLGIRGSQDPAVHTHPVAGTSPATWSAVGWGVVVVCLMASAATNAAWGWDSSASLLFSLGQLALVVSGALLVITEVHIGRQCGRLGIVATLGVAVSVIGVLLSFVAWAVVLWTTVLGAGTLLFGVPLLRRRVLPRPWGHAFIFAVPAASLVAWAGAVVFDAGGDDASDLVVLVNDGLVAAALLVLAAGLAGVGRWLRTGRQ